MLCNRLIACIIVADGMVVQSKQFKHTNVVGNAETATDFFTMWAVDELIVVDASRNLDNRPRFLRAIDCLSRHVFVPLAIGGWVRTTDDARELLNLGADKIIINTQAFRTPEFISAMAEKFGSQCVVVSIDCKGGKVYIDRGQRATEVSAMGWANTAQKYGAGEIFLTSIDHDGMLNGYDLDLVSSVSKAVTIPVVASGGVGSWEHLVEGIRVGADAVSAANIFHYSEQSTKKAKEYMLKAGLNVRPINFFHNEEARNVDYGSYTKQ